MRTALLKNTALFGAVVLVLMADRFLKSLSVVITGEREIIGQIFTFNPHKNLGIAFSLPVKGVLLNILVLLIIIGLAWYLVYLMKKADYLIAGCVFAVILGAASNLFDRFKFGYVVDYLDLSFYSVFNLADVLIVMGLFGVLWLGVDKK